MSSRLLQSAPALAFFVFQVSPSFAASWETNFSYGGNMPADLYVPDEPADSPPIVVSMHYCSGNKDNAHGWFQSYADMYGFIIITPQAGGNCFDAAAQRSGERAEIVAMVQYAIMQYNGDPNRVFAAGASSGACMTQALLAAYPEVFAAGSSLAGVPAGAWTSGNNYGWSAPMQSDQQWGDQARQASDGFMGTWPRIQLWHGQGDTTLTYSQTYPAEVAQWTNVHGVTDADAMEENVQPPGAQDTWDRKSYTDASGSVVVEANSAGGQVPHDLTGRGLWGDVVRFFALDAPAEPETGMGGMGGMGSGGQGMVGDAGGAGMPNTGGAGGSMTGMDNMMATAGASGSAMPPTQTGGDTGSIGSTTTPTPVGMTMTTNNTPTGSTPAGMTGSTMTPTTNVGGTTTGQGGTTATPGGGMAAGTPAPSTSASGAMVGLNGADTSDTGSNGGGCSVASPNRQTSQWLTLFGLGALGAVFSRRRRRQA